MISIEERLSTYLQEDIGDDKPYTEVVAVALPRGQDCIGQEQEYTAD